VYFYFHFLCTRFFATVQKEIGRIDAHNYYFQNLLAPVHDGNSDTIFRFRSQFSPSVRSCWIYSQPDCHLWVAISVLNKKSHFLLDWRQKTSQAENSDKTIRLEGKSELSFLRPEKLKKGDETSLPTSTRDSSARNAGVSRGKEATQRPLTHTHLLRRVCVRE
jgi:hypothetical protein